MGQNTGKSKSKVSELSTGLKKDPQHSTGIGPKGRDEEQDASLLVLQALLFSFLVWVASEAKHMYNSIFFIKLIETSIQYSAAAVNVYKKLCTPHLCQIVHWMQYRTKSFMQSHDYMRHFTYLCAGLSHSNNKTKGSCHSKTRLPFLLSRDSENLR